MRSIRSYLVTMTAARPSNRPSDRRHSCADILFQQTKTPEPGERGADGPEHQDDRIELDRVAQATAVILRVCGLSAELFDKVKRPELDGHIRLHRVRCAAECP